MALTTPMDLGEAQRLGRDFGLQVVGLEPLSRGVNSNFVLELDGGGRAFARVHELVGPPAVERHNRLVAHLAAAGVPTPAPLRRAAGGTVGDHHGKPVALFPFVPGAWICQARVRQRHCRAIGQALGRIHRVGATYRNAPANRYDVEQLGARLQTLVDMPLDADVRGHVKLLTERLAELRPRLEKGAARSIGVIHGDLFRDNVLWIGEQGIGEQGIGEQGIGEQGIGDELSAVLDFEYASAGLVAFDLAVTLLAWCFTDRLEQPLAVALLAGYRSERSLEDDELSGCFDQARLAAVRFAVSRIGDYELKPRGSITYKDYRRFVARLEALEGIGRDGFAAWLRCAQ